jgi:hypothetical protein
MPSFPLPAVFPFEVSSLSALDDLFFAMLVTRPEDTTRLIAVPDGTFEPAGGI